MVYNYTGDIMNNQNIDNIKLIEDQRKKLDLLKIKLESNKPFSFQKKEMKKYKENLNKLNAKIDECDNLLMKEYQNLE